MSTSITGFILNEGADPFALSRKAREVFLPRLQKTIYTEFLEHLIEAYDMASYSTETNKSFRKSHDIKKGPLDFYHVVLAAKKSEKAFLEDTPDHYQVQLGFAPDPLTGRILCAWFGAYENREIFADFDEVEDFSYWNSSEGPEDVSEEDWQKRIEAWDRALLPSSHVSSSVLMSKVAAPHELSLNVSFDDMKEAGAVIPSREWRINKLAQHFLVGEWVKEQDDAITHFSGMFGAMRDPDRIAKWTEIVSAKIGDEEITIDTVRDWSYNRKEINP